MRIGRRSVVILSSAAALAVGGIAYAVTAGAHPPGGGCNPGAPQNSCVDFSFTPLYPPVTPRVAGSLFVHTDTHFTSPGACGSGGCHKHIVLRFDSDFLFTPGTIPNCTAVFSSSTTIAQAWEACGPGADVPASDPKPNAYLSPPGGVSGKVHTVPAGNFDGCLLVFKKSATQVLLFMRVTAQVNSTANCANPATNTAGNVTATLPGTLADDVAPYGQRLTIPNMDTLPLKLDDLRMTLGRGNYVKAKCSGHNGKIYGRDFWRLQGRFTYTDSPTPNPDVVDAKKWCQSP